MIEEPGRVVAVESGVAWVETTVRSSCSSCAASTGCGQGLLERLGTAGRCRRVRALSDMPLRVGDPVVIGIPEGVLLRSALAVYLLPLMGLILFALAAQWLGFGEPLVIAGGFSGFALVWLLVRRASRRVMNDPALQPVVLRVLSAASGVQADRVAF